MSVRLLLFVAAVSILTGCSRPRATAPTAEPTTIPVPTFTPTPVDSTPPPAPPTPTAVAVAEPATDAAADTVAEDAATANAAADGTVSLVLVPTATPAATPAAPEGALPGNLVVTGAAVNVRQWPGVEYPIVGDAVAGETFVPIGRNAAGDWWQVCCFGEEPGWLFAPLVDAQGSIDVAVVTDIPAPPTPEPTATTALAESAAPADEAAGEASAPNEGGDALQHSGTAGNFDPAAQYHVVGYRIIGYGENNGGIFNNGGQHIIFINVIDAAGNGIDGVVLKNAIDDNINIVTGSKGPGRAEFEMFWDPYKLYVASDASGPVTSQITNQMNTAYPHIPDIIGRLGPPEEEYAICPTPDDRCEPPFYHAHWSYEVTFQKVR